MNRRRILLSAAAMAIGVVFGLPQAAGASDIKTIRFGLIPSEDAEKLIAESKPFIDAFEKALGMPIKPFVALDYTAVVEAIRSNQLEVAFLGPAAYVLAKDKVGAPVAPVSRGVMAYTGQSAYHMLIITQPDSPINKVEDLKGRTFAFVDPASTSGGLLPSLVLHQHGLDPQRDFSTAYYSGTHQASLIAVLEKKVNAAAIADEVYDLALQRNQIKPGDLKIIYKSEPVPGSPFVIRTNLPEDIQNRLRTALLQLGNVKFGKLGEITRMDPAVDSDYDIVRTMNKFREAKKN
jgi:phosphonate transport system substrate-binding protein